MKVLASLLRVWLKKNNKILIFSGSTKLLDIVEQMLIRIGTEYTHPHSHWFSVHSHWFSFQYEFDGANRYSRLDGATQIKLRSNMCKEFNTGNVS
jgi:SNF2 family DNA or RNA helicase